MSKKSKKEELLKDLKACSLISINGVSYFGKVQKKDNTITIGDSVECEYTLEETVTKWIKASNLNQLNKLEVSGTGTIVTKDLTEDQEDEVELVAFKAAKAFATAVPDLVNSKF